MEHSHERREKWQYVGVCASTNSTQDDNFTNFVQLDLVLGSCPSSPKPRISSSSSYCLSRDFFLFSLFLLPIIISLLVLSFYLFSRLHWYIFFLFIFFFSLLLILRTLPPPPPPPLPPPPPPLLHFPSSSFNYLHNLTQTFPHCLSSWTFSSTSITNFTLISPPSKISCPRSSWTSVISIHGAYHTWGKIIRQEKTASKANLREYNGRTSGSPLLVAVNTCEREA